MATISLCMIVKNEEAVLDRCLSSIADLMDEIIIVDTGSTDATKEIASRYTDQIYDFPWTDDFSEARNFSFSKASMEYIYAADADEVVDYENHRRFLYLKQSLHPQVDIVQMKYITPDEFNTVMNIKDEYRPKLYKRLRQFYWIDPIHETVRTQPFVFDSDIEILHMPQSGHSGRDFELFLHAFQSGRPFSDKLYMMYARELYISGADTDFCQAQAVFEQALQNEENSPQRAAEALCVLCRCMRIQNNVAGLFKYAVRSMAYHACAEICCELGAYFSRIEDYEEAVRWYRCAAYETSSILDVHTSGDFPLFRLADCYEHMADGAAELGRSGQYRQMAQEYRAAAEDWEMPQENQ